jgi:hypothetical protein
MSLQTVREEIKARPESTESFPLEGFHRRAAAVVLESVGFDSLTDWEQAFVSDMAANTYPTINEKQWSVLGRLIAGASRVERRAAGRKS